VTSTYTWIKSGTLSDATTTNTFNIETSTKALAYNKHYLRQKITDAQVATSSVLYDYFHVEIDHVCRADELSITIANDIGDATYTFNESSGAAVDIATPTVTNSVADCTVAYALFGFNTASDKWEDFSDATGPLAYIISAFNTTTGKVTVLNTAGTKTSAGDLKPQTLLNLKVVATSSDSVAAGKTVEDEFTLTMRESKCVNNKLALDTSTNANSSSGVVIPDIAYTWDTTAVTKTPAYSTTYTDADCPITAELYTWSESANAWT